MSVYWVFNDLPKLSRRTRTGTFAGLKAVGAAMQKAIDANTPVDTGRLKSNNKVTVDQGALTATYENETPYAGFVELGTSKMAPRLFATRGMREVEREFTSLMGKPLGDALRGGR